MNHAAKRAGRRKRRRLRRWFCLVGIWAAALAVLLALGALEQRAQSAPVGVRLSYRGQARQVDAAGLTAAQLLKRLGLALTPEDTVTPAAKRAGRNTPRRCPPGSNTAWTPPCPGDRRQS